MKLYKFDNIQNWSDQDIEAEILRIQSVIKEWAVSKDLWHDCGFKSYLEHVDGEPSLPPVATMLWAEGSFRSCVFDGYDGLDIEFFDLLEANGYSFENVDGVTAEIYPNDETLSKKFEEYFHWQWVCSLVKEDTADVYDEIYAHFVNNPDDLHKIKPRDFEILLFRIFQNQGFRAILGPGSGDEGIDIHLWHEDPLGDVLTVVQAKRYAPHRAINLTEVQALHTARSDENAHKALFVTTSKYAPVAKRFAGRRTNLLQLAEKDQVIDWCSKATNGIIADKSSLLSPRNVEVTLQQLSIKPDHRIVHSSGGYNMTNNTFAVVVKESRHAVLLMGLRNQTVSDDGYGQRGYQTPILNPESGVSLLNADNVWRAKRIEKDGEISYWDGKNLFSTWNGNPVYFDYMD